MQARVQQDREISAFALSLLLAMYTWRPELFNTEILFTTWRTILAYGDDGRRLVLQVSALRLAFLLSGWLIECAQSAFDILDLGYTVSSRLAAIRVHRELYHQLSFLANQITAAAPQPLAKMTECAHKRSHRLSSSSSSSCDRTVVLAV